MQRCIELALNGAGSVSPNPLVGCVIVHNQTIIGEGWHQQFGQPHAEVNAIQSVKDKSLLKDAILYVNLEPCNHFGKTPPCADLLVTHQLKNVVVGMVDPYDKVAGNGVKKLRDAGIEVTVGVLENECKFLNRRFIKFVTQLKPYVILKWAQTWNGYIAPDATKLSAEDF
jgi:diaminohydroxyphosphoribosylaminopyrimidine deaminase/5-amino-6-(5-phosphoribosylamino)uracil reductase